MDYPGRLQHQVPAWVPAGALYHIRIRAEPSQEPSLTHQALSGDLLASARRYHGCQRWWCNLILLMPDHLHALLVFPEEKGLAQTIRDWKRGVARCHGVRWQSNFFDHRIRNDRSGTQKWAYIRNNPVAKGLCACADDWPHWWSAFSEAPRIGGKSDQ